MQPILVLVHGHPDNPRVWDPVVELLSGRFRIVRYDAGEVAAALDGIEGDAVHVLAHGWGSAAVWQYLARAGSRDRVASFTAVSGPAPEHVARYLRDTLSRPHRPRAFAGGLGQLARLAVAAPKALTSKAIRANIARADAGSVPVDTPVQVIVATGDPYVSSRLYDDTTAWASRLWRRDVVDGHVTPATHPQLLARAVTQLVDHLDGAPAARELLRAQVGRPRKAFGDMLVAVTGAASGIGRATALAFARDGADVVVSDVDATGLEETARLVAAEGAQAYPFIVDVADAAAVEAFAEQVTAEQGVPDIVVNNAGVGHAGFFLDTPAEEFDRVLDINLGGVVNGCRSFGRLLRDRGTGGHIVNVASMASYTPVNVMNAYCTSKAAVFMFSDCLRAELDSFGVGLTTICPGFISTNIVDTTRFSLGEGRDGEELRARARKGFTARHYGPEKVADAIVAAVKSNTAIRPVAPEAHFVYGVAHVLPQALRSTARGGNFV
ncbi:SDR family oxidoreductase [Mycobacterium sp. 236(2023)]|uniref:SDR family oxidoreductase n=1 Tax=Mycobacterium sp. 236(2023) TaxID=3038163 RepID=UPI0024153536|nr:SDR family oxidoreductase [Mycobacterium sp. 236(2023)]MDG4666416.1 SDR family oxidoreductase [Mycobacterium sp. 236(2023)]